MQIFSWNDCTKVELQVWHLVSAPPFPAAGKSAYLLQVGCGAGIGMRKSSAQITHLDQPDELEGKLIVALSIFLPSKSVRSVRMSGHRIAYGQGEVALCVPDKTVLLVTKTTKTL